MTLKQYQTHIFGEIKVSLLFYDPKMFSTDFLFRHQENLADNQKCQAGFRPLCNKILFLIEYDWSAI